MLLFTLFDLLLVSFFRSLFSSCVVVVVVVVLCVEELIVIALEFCLTCFAFSLV